MASVRLGAALRQIHGLFEAGTVAGLTDGQLLDRYLARRDESAFAALVMRHGPMVLGVCHAVLHGSPEVEDAFQATFLVLIRKAGTIRGRDAVGGWLHRVAHRVAVAGRPRSLAEGSSRARVSDLSALIVAVGESPVDDDWRISAARGARAAARAIPPAGRALLPGRQDPRAGRPRAALERGDPPPPPGRCPRPAPLPADPARRRRVERPPWPPRWHPEATAAVPPGWVDALARDRRRDTPSRPPRLAWPGRWSGACSPDRSRPSRTSSILLVAMSLVAGHLVPAGPARADAIPPGRPLRLAPSPPPAQASSPSDPHDPIEPERSLTVRGRVLDPDGKPFAGAKVYAYRPDPREVDILFAPGPPAPDAISDADGRFQFAIADPGFERSQDAGDLEPPDRRGPGPRIRAGLGLVHHGRRGQGPDAQAGPG